MGLRDEISQARLAALDWMQREQAGRRFPPTMPGNFFRSKRWRAEYRRVDGFIWEAVPRVLDEAGIAPFEYSPRREFRSNGPLRQIFHILDLGHPSSWERVRSPDSYEVRFLHEIDPSRRSSVVRLKGGQEVASDLLTEPLLREYIIARLSDPRIVLPG